MRVGIIVSNCSTGKYVEIVGWGRGGGKEKPCIYNNFETILYKHPA
jgi:hypothetical protein